MSLIIIVFLLLLSAFFSGSETSFFSLTSIQLKKMENEEKKKKGYRRVLRLLSRPKELLILILLGNTIVNVAASATATLIAIKLFPNSHILVLFFEIIIMTSVILVFGEVIPKLIAISSPEKFARKSAIILEVIKIILWPVVKILELLSNAISKKGTSNQDLSISDVKEFLEHDVPEELMNDEGKKILFRIFRFNKTVAEEIMRPRVDIVAVDENESKEKIKETIVKKGFSKIPIYKDDIDNIIGYVHAKDLILYPEKPISKIIREPLIVPEVMPIPTLLNLFKKSKIHIAIVVDEYGGTSGLITPEDIFEEIVGEIEDEYDTDDIASIKKVGENKYLINGMTSIKEINEELSLDLPEESYSNIAEFITAQKEGFPKQNELIIYKDIYSFRVARIRRKRIIAVVLEIKIPNNKQ